MPRNHLCTYCGFFEVCDERFKWQRCRRFVKEAEVNKHIDAKTREQANKQRKKLLQQKRVEEKQKQKEKLKKVIRWEIQLCIILFVCVYPHLMQQLNNTLIMANTNADMIMALIILFSTPMLIAIIYWGFIEEKRKRRDIKILKSILLKKKKHRHNKKCDKTI